MSYNTDNIYNPTFFIAGMGTGKGIESTGSPVDTKTVVDIPVFSPFLPF